MAITIYINGKKKVLQDNTMNISKILEMKRIRPEVVTVELNNIIIEREKYAKTPLKEGDRLEFVYYMGGGGSTPLRFTRGRSPF